MKCAIIDVGSNTIRLSVYQIKDGKFRILFSQKSMAGLAGYVERGRLSERGMEKAGEVLTEFTEILRNFSIEEVHIFATASLRNVENTQEAVEYIDKTVGCKVEVISGEEEAYLDYVGALHSVEVINGVLVDIGGGSTEVVRFQGQDILKAVCAPVGSLSLFSRYVEKILPKKKEYQSIVTEVHNALDAAGVIGDENGCEVICGVGGTIRAALKLNNYLFNESRSNHTISAEHLEYIVKLLADKDMTARNLILKVCPERVHTIVPGLCILVDIIQRYQTKKIVVSSYGVREGYLCDRVINRAEGGGISNG